MLTTLCFDADDTLWHNERFFKMTQAHFADLLRDYAPPDHLAERLLDAERRNLGRYGFGIKGFVLSMIETALEVTDNKLPGTVVHEILLAGQDMLSHPIELLPGVENTIRRLAGDYDLCIVTKGDLLDQERKIAQSGLGELFDGVEIVSEKTPEVYAGILARRRTAPEAALMVGNSLKSDVNPAIAIGAWGVHIPHGLEWELEAADPPIGHARFRRIERMDRLPDLVRDIEHNT